jgi:Tol biopolymer transport system component
MSPEQARGQRVDRRADIWAFGVVLYEVLTGLQLFRGETVSDVLAAVLTQKLDWTGVPAKAERLLCSCLQRDPKQRLQAIGDWRLTIEDGTEVLGPEDTPAPRSPALLWAAIGALVLALAALSLVHFRETPQRQRTLRYTITVPENSTVHTFALSPDGRYVAIAAAIQGKRQLWLQALVALQAQPMPNTEDATFPFWSPDGRYIGFFAQGQLKKIAASGGPPQSLCDAVDGRGGTWNRADVIVFSPGPGTAIQRVPAAGGVPADVVKTKFSRFPEFLPDGRHFLYLVSQVSPEKEGVYVSSLDGRENRRVLADTSSVVFADGYVFFVRERTLVAQQFDAGRALVSGDVVPVAKIVSPPADAFAAVTVSENGVLLYAGDSSAADDRLVWFDRTGKPLGPAGELGLGDDPSISANEKMIAFRRQTSGRPDIWLRDLVHGTDIRFTSEGQGNVEPFWSPKGDRIVFVSGRATAPDLYQKATGGSGRDELLLSSTNSKVADQWSRDGRLIVYSEQDPKTKMDLWVLPVSENAPGDRKPIPFLQTEFNELHGQLSPDTIGWRTHRTSPGNERCT